MRADLLKKILDGDEFNVIDTHIPFYNTPKLFRSVGFRYKKGPLIRNVNRYIRKNLGEQSYDCIWTDKAVFITYKTTKLIRSHTTKLVHFTPDPAFTYHRSIHFLNSLALYDFTITTKSYELSDYRKILNDDKVLITTQGFDKEIHKPWQPFNEKKEGVTFIGHWEKDREKNITALLNNHIKVVLAGRGWHKFYKRNLYPEFLDFRGESILGPEYAQLLSEYTFSLGLLSKWVDEKHTTRTFEIPACGTALITEKNEEINRFFRNDEVIFYDTLQELVQKIKYYINHRDELEILCLKGYDSVIHNGYDYESILRGVLKRMEIIH